ncbi:alpha-1,3-arabinosyltransferase XAT3-like isoform X1 [Zingiber officinale]|uniref:Glycosyltransferase 61 catalytic domain-containing protein n=1 Tax=Zingiber officinale TaxID=94328 RepID=A0A8J5GRX4_ZINOF|nr:alpha-1,3-arabinosyltransferase XAT3-like isoform X1 [Zingiber officinale]KAG6508830.1 hypothetical protein ZIOFF_034212 [Zingiber officinale]
MAKPFRNLNRAKPQSYGVGLLVVFILVSLTYVTMSGTNKMRISLANSQLVQVVDVNYTSIKSYPSTGKEAAEKEKVVVVEKNSSAVPEEVFLPTGRTGDQGVPAVEKKPICDLSNRKSDVCEAAGDVRIVGKNTRMVYVAPPPDGNREGESWTIKPYARKWDVGSGGSVREVTLRLVNDYGDDGRCAVNYSIPALVFAIGGWSGINFFHDFGDVLVPLFQSAAPFSGEVQLLVANNKPGWVQKFRPYFDKLSRYPVIEFDEDDAVRCFPRVTLGLRCSSIEDFQMEPAKSPQGYSMVDFAEFTRSAFGLPRKRPTLLPEPLVGGEQSTAKARLMLIARAKTRRFTNVEEIVRMAEGAGFEVVVTEASDDIAKFSRVVNSCDVLMGVHGSALTNMVFLPRGGVVIQVVPWGKLDWIAGHYFRDPAKQMEVKYLEYSINEEETTLSEQYPREHAVFKDPMSVHHQGWDTFSRIFLKEQNVRLNVTRFRPFLDRARLFISQQHTQAQDLDLDQRGGG